MFEVIIAFIGIVITTIVAIVSIRKTAKESRISTIHAEMITCITETLYLSETVLNLLNDVGYHKVYRSIPNKKIIETAYARYWRELGNISKEFKKLYAKQRLLLPQQLYDEVQNLLIDINEARKIAREAKPDDNNRYPDTTELIKIIEIASEKLINLINGSRKFIGTNELKPISKEGALLLQNAEEKEII